LNSRRSTLPTMLFQPIWTFVAILSFQFVFAAEVKSKFLSRDSKCRCLPEDSCWPSTAQWTAFNESIGGKLIATIPIASSCHFDAFETFNSEECTALQNVWNVTETHWQSSSSIMANFFANESCDPFSAPTARCIIGTYIQYAVNASSATDYQATIDFVKLHNIRLVIRNTGHDFYGKSTGAGALGIWTHNLKNIDVVDYKSSIYTGKAMKIGAGVQGQDATKAANAHGLTVLTGNCQTVGIAGGFTQGGGHSFLSSKYGLGADQALEWEVVTGEGELLVATPEENNDLYWALTGGGGGTYGVVLSLTVRAFPDEPTSGANLLFTSTSVDDFYDVMEIFVGILPALADLGAGGAWIGAPGSFSLAPVLAPGVSQIDLDAKFVPVIEQLNASGIEYSMLPYFL
jgi:hypothetical protein